MGGDAFPGIVILTPAEHSRIRDLVLSSLTQSPHLSPTLLITSSAEILDKSSFGDVDLYASCNPTCSSSRPDRVLDAMIEFLVETLRCPEKPGRAKWTQCVVPGYQVDVGFAMDAAQLGMHAAVYSNGDFARLLQVSLTRRGLRLTAQRLFSRGKSQRRIRTCRSRRERFCSLWTSRRWVSFSVSLPTLPTATPPSRSLSRAGLRPHRLQPLRFFDAAAMITWTQTVYTSTSKSSRPMIESFDQWWHSTGKPSPGNPSCDCDCGDEEAWVDFFGAGRDIESGKGSGRRKRERAMEMRKECKQLLNFGMIQSWFPVLSKARVGARGVEEAACGA